MQPVRILVASLACCLAAACDSPRTHVNAHELSVAAQQLESLAREAAWLADQLRTRNITDEMAWVHQQAISEDAGKAMQQLTRPVPAELREQQDAVARIAAQLQSHATRIAGAVNHPDELQGLQHDFESLADAAHPIGQQA